MNDATPDAATLAAALANLPGWTHDGAFIRKTFVFKDFVAAFGWMTKVAFEAEKLNHHPDWTNVYHTVKVALQTHDATPPGVTGRDLELAGRMEALLVG